jgi:CTP synthase
LSFFREKLDIQVLSYFRLKPKKRANLNPWKKITKIILQNKKNVNIAIIGKYVELKDAYKSLDEALTHGGIENKIKVNLVRIDSEKLKVHEIKKKLKDISGILIPGGFGKRGTDGKIEAIKHARLNKIPFLGICFGMQMAIIEFARNQLNLKNATSSEFDKKGLPIIGLINEWTKSGKIIKGTDKNLGGTMRLGSYDAKLKENSQIRKIYKTKMIKERHRHRYEVNVDFKDKFEKKGMIFSGLSPDNKLPEIIELKNHPWFIGVQFHPEFKSRPLAPHPLFSSFIKAAKNHK